MTLEQTGTNTARLDYAWSPSRFVVSPRPLEQTGENRTMTTAEAAPTYSMGAGDKNPTSLRPGSLVYLWAPGEKPGEGKPVLARVERTTTETIVGKDLGTSVRAKYDVGSWSAGLRWTWELAAEPEHATLVNGVELVQRESLEADALREMVFGACGEQVRIRLTNGDPGVVGVITRIIMDGSEPRWIEVTGPSDMRGQTTDMVKFDWICGVSRTGGKA